MRWRQLGEEAGGHERGIRNGYGLWAGKSASAMLSSVKEWWEWPSEETPTGATTIWRDADRHDEGRGRPSQWVITGFPKAS